MAMRDLSLFSLEQLKTWLKLGGETSQDAVLEILGQGAADYCEQRIGTKFRARDYTITRSGDGRPKLLRLPRPIISVASVTVNGATLDPSEYVFDVDKGLLQRTNGVFCTGVANVVVVLTAGYADADMPGHVVAAALDLAKSHYEEWTNGAISLSSISIGPATAVIKPGLNPRIEKFLDAQKDVRA